MGSYLCKVVFYYICCLLLYLIIFAGKPPYRVNDPLQGLKSIIDGEDVILTVCNLCQLEQKETHKTVNVKD